MLRGRAWWVLTVLNLAGCSSGLEGFWIGRLDCAGLPFDFEMTLEKSEAKTYTGTGEQSREFTSIDGKITTHIIEFSVTLEQDKASGAQTLASSIDCTSELLVETPAGGGDAETIADACEPLRYRDYQFDWDGEEVISVLGADGCDGDLTLR